MATPSPAPVAGGAPIAIGCLLGVVAGVFVRQPTLGLLIGFGLGVAVALLIWWRDRARS